MQPRRMVFPSALVLSVYVKFKLLLDFVQIAHLIDDLAVPAVAVISARRAFDKFLRPDFRQLAFQPGYCALRFAVCLSGLDQLRLLPLQTDRFAGKRISIASVPAPINMAKTRNGLILFFFEAIPPIPRIF